MNKLTTNFHGHTFRCGHAQGTDEEYVLKAIENGYKEIGFSDHYEIAFDSVPGYNNGNKTLLDYISSIKSLKEKYKDKITIHIGLECAYFPDYKDLFESFKKLGVEYFIQGQHQVYNDKGEKSYLYESDDFPRPLSKSHIKRYVDILCEGIRSRMFLYVAHPDYFVYKLDEIDDYAIEQMRVICECAKENNVPLEINLGGLRAKEKIKYPTEELFKIAGEVGNLVIIGVDAHNPSHYEVNGQDFAYYLVEKYNLKLIDRPNF